jgi:hypothetical protein
MSSTQDSMLHTRYVFHSFGVCFVVAAICRGEAVLEWDYRNGDPPAPLVAKVFGAERRKAKILNFSIAYGMSCLVSAIRVGTILFLG